jgi:hypothetical protein
MTDGTRRWGFAAFFYLAWFVLLTWPAIGRSRTHLLTDAGDGLQNVWNLWWMRKALVELHTWPLYTRHLHFPDGVTLIGHTLNPFNGLLAIPLLAILPLTVVHNIIIVFSFVAAGLTAYALCRHVSGSHWGSLWGGFVFAFSSFHFAHAQGHMQMVAVEWIPLFLLCWLRWLESPAAARAAAAASALVLVFLCDLYFTLFSLLAAAVIAVWRAARTQGPVSCTLRDYARSGLVFVGLAGPPLGAFAAALLYGHRHDPLLGIHDPAENSMDLLAPFIYGGHWRFAALTAPYWRHIAGNVHESSLHLGWSVIAALVCCAAWRRRMTRPGVGLWFLLGGIFAVLALGPVLRVWGRPIAWVPMPYDALALAIPPLRLAGAVARFFVMTYLAAGVLVALVYPTLRAGPLRGRWRPAAGAALLVLEYWPAPLPLTRVAVPAYVKAIAAAPGDGGVIDLVNKPPIILYHQTLHERPIAFGYIARFPASALVRAAPIATAAKELTEHTTAADAARRLAADGFRWVIANAPPAPPPGLDRLYTDADVVVYDLRSHARPNVAAK